MHALHRWPLGSVCRKFVNRKLSQNCTENVKKLYRKLHSVSLARKVHPHMPLGKPKCII